MPPIAPESNVTDYSQPIPLNEEQQIALVNQVVKQHTQWKQARQPLEARWQECWQAYHCDVKNLYTQPDAHHCDRSHIARPVIYEAVEGIHANLLNALFPADERFFSVMGKTEADQVNAKTIEDYLQYKIDSLGFIEHFGLFLKQAIIIGNSIAAVPWRTRTRQRRVRQPVTVLDVTVGHQELTVDELVENGPGFDVLDMFDVLLDPDAPSFEEAKLIRKIERPLHQVLKNPAYCNLDGLTAFGDDTESTGKQSRRDAFGINNTVLDDADSRKEAVLLYEVWGDFLIDDTVYPNHVCVIANKQRVIRFEPNPFDHGRKPFVFTNFIPVPNEVYGISAIEKSLGLQHAINTLTNQKLDVINISINSPFTYLVNDDIFDPDTVVTRPGALIPVKSHDTLKPIQYLNNYTVAFEEIADLKAEIQEATGALKYFTGSEHTSNAQRTATEVSALVNGGSQKFSSFIGHLEHTSLDPFLQMVFENARQFLIQPELICRSCGDGQQAFEEIAPELLQQSQCHFKVDGSQLTLMKTQEMESLIAFANLVRQDPAIAKVVNVVELYKKIYRRLGFKDEQVMFPQAD